MATKLEIIQLKAKCAMGEPYALYLLGQNYLFGTGVPCDIPKAYKLIEKARLKGLEEADQCIKDTFVVDSDGNILFESKGYTIGLGEQILRYFPT